MQIQVTDCYVPKMGTALLPKFTGLLLGCSFSSIFFISPHISESSLRVLPTTAYVNFCHVIQIHIGVTPDLVQIHIGLPPDLVRASSGVVMVHNTLGKFVRTFGYFHSIIPY
jgi:hypothetical protein